MYVLPYIRVFGALMQQQSWHKQTEQPHLLERGCNGYAQVGINPPKGFPYVLGYLESNKID